MWDFEALHDDRFGASYCASCPSVCAECPRPRLLPAATFAVAAYLECRTQWMYAPSGRPTGLRYDGCTTRLRAFARRHGLDRKMQERMFEGLCVIEAAVVAVAIEQMPQQGAGHEG